MNKLISVIVPVYNVEKYLKKCIDSILEQEYTNLEIILVDDGSTDNSGNICDEYKKIDSRIKVIHKKNGGLSDARNKGINISTGDYLSFVDSDDFIDRKLYQDFIDNCHEDIDIYIFGILKVYDGVPFNYNKKGKISILNNIESMSKILNYELNNFACDKIYKRELFKSVEFPVNRSFEDIGTIYKLILNSNKIMVNSSEYYGYYQRSSSITGNMSEKSIIDRIELENNRYSYIYHNFDELKDDLINDRLYQIYRYHIDTCKYTKNRTLYDSELLMNEYLFYKSNYKYLKNKSILSGLLNKNRFLFYFLVKLILKFKR
ncbi:MAG: glycosyltransferase family 2 protein [Candidatus Coprovivens sp.]